MGTWNAGLFSNDTTLDVRDAYMELLEQQLSNEEAYQKTVEIFGGDIIGTDEEPLFWYALADTQWNVGRLMPDVKEMALKLIDEKGGISLWEEDRRKMSRWERTLQKLKEKLESPVPPEKKIRKPVEFERNPWTLGDVYAYQFHTEKAVEHGLSGKYILFQKVGDINLYKDHVFSVVRVFDHVFDSIPVIETISGIRVLPLVYPPGVNGGPDNPEEFIPSFEYYMKAIMLYDKKVHYPKKHMTFVGNQCVSKSEYDGGWGYKEFYWEKDKMEDWLVDYYLGWQNVEY